jgi:hypothetical protein
MNTVLDLDLDFLSGLLTPTHLTTTGCRADEVTYLAKEEDVRSFLEQRCHLSRSSPIPGKEVIEHEEAFRIWRSWIKEGKLRVPFAVIHVDAHADLGAGVNLTCCYIQTELLTVPLGERCEPRFGPTGLNSGNYLMGAIANRWIERLTYVFPTNRTLPDEAYSKAAAHAEQYAKILALCNAGAAQQPPVGDLPAWCFRDGDWETGLIELKRIKPEDFLKYDPAPVHVEPAVPFNLTPESEANFFGFTHIVVAQSPQYTPPLADSLLCVIREYYDPV